MNTFSNTSNMGKYLAIPFGKHSYYLVYVETGRSQNDREIEISQAQYEYLLQENQKYSAEIRAIRNDKNEIELKAFRDYAPSEYHIWDMDSASWMITEEDKLNLESRQKENKLKQRQDQKIQLQTDMNMHLLLDEKEEAKAIAQQIKDINSEIEKLKE
ncbi:hypothetical protein [Wohlfahrtiimonas chitiniclastica]|uniref:hypothetical protein n=1 Tax=Wohlfahrtiimonas chitiniclastica TaxID=400946 RepID=UPI000B98EE96|nr:hypothetical protein [Wohlfahrtiimonas chitiniclastica]OYQ76089.1 hypothetical protein B9T18_01660 [Wohlfahrtiimonas chitiniclastica]